ncbi:MAG TPA: hypothetical protein PK624_14615 [Spirochaetota bacterium]|nr:hypothetical protein [Spirochaetota bacterium]HPK57683.1 hypothetical protein [Spirochaetota bacterium]
MKRIFSIVAAISVFAIFSSSFISGEENSPKKNESSNVSADKKDADIKRAENAVVKNKTALDNADKKVSEADAEIKAGNEMINEGKSDEKRIYAEIMRREKENKAAKTILEKQSKSKDKEEAMQARSEMKIIDDKEKADMRNFNSKLKACDKKIKTGEQKVAKAISKKDSASQNQLKAKKNYDDAVVELEKVKAAKK